MPRLMVIGPAALREQIAVFLPEYDCTGTERALEGLWQSGGDSFDGIVFSLTGAGKALRTLQCLREVSPGIPIVVTCDPVDEPRARQAMECGATDYLLEPLDADELSTLFPARRPRFTGPALPASEHDLLQYAEVLRQLGDGPDETLKRLAEMFQQTFEAVGVSIEIARRSARVGQLDEPVLREPIRRDGQVVGGITLGRRAAGVYDSATAERLGIFGRLVELTIALSEQQQKLHEMAWTDDLSGLRNRRYFEHRLRGLIEQAARERLRITVLLFDIDGFKQYNDEFGHGTGDELIKEVAVLLTHASRETDIIARYGGDEFGVIMWDAEAPRVPGSHHPTAADELAERFRRVIHEHEFRCLGAKAPGPVTISGGLASFPWDARDADQLIHLADEALLCAKRTGKNRIVLTAENHTTPPENRPDNSPTERSSH